MTRVTWYHIVFVAINTFASGAKASVLIDVNFTHGIPSTFTNYKYSEPEWSVDADQGQLRITKSVSVDKQSTSGGIESLFQLSGDFAITVDYFLDEFDFNGNNTSRLGIREVVDQGERELTVLRFRQSSRDATEMFSNQFPHGIVGPDGPDQLAWQFSDAVAGKYRLERVGNVITGSYAPEGQDFIVLGRMFDSVSPVTVLLFANQNQSGTSSAMDISFDNLVIEAESIPEPSTLVIFFGLGAVISLGRIQWRVPQNIGT